MKNLKNNLKTLSIKAKNKFKDTVGAGFIEYLIMLLVVVVVIGLFVLPSLSNSSKKTTDAVDNKITDIVNFQ